MFSVEMPDDMALKGMAKLMLRADFRSCQTSKDSLRAVNDEKCIFTTKLREEHEHRSLTEQDKAIINNDVIFSLWTESAVLAMIAYIVITGSMFRSFHL
jgi:hypothetical protein